MSNQQKNDNLENKNKPQTLIPKTSSATREIAKNNLTNNEIEKNVERSPNESNLTTKSCLSRNLALKLSNDIKDSALLSSIQLFEDQRTITPPSLSNTNDEFLSTSNRFKTSTKSLSVNANSKSLSSLLLINTTGNFSYDGASTSTATTPVPNESDITKNVGFHSRHNPNRLARYKLARSDSITGLDNQDEEENFEASQM